jgi:hypothetical protein
LVFCIGTRFSYFVMVWRGGRAVECTALEILSWPSRRIPTSTSKSCSVTQFRFFRRSLSVSISLRATELGSILDSKVLRLFSVVAKRQRPDSASFISIRASRLPEHSARCCSVRSAIPGGRIVESAAVAHVHAFDDAVAVRCFGSPCRTSALCGARGCSNQRAGFSPARFGSRPSSN